MLSRVLLLLVFSPIVAVAVVAIGAVLALQLALGPIAAEIAGCTQWTRA